MSEKTQITTAPEGAGGAAVNPRRRPSARAMTRDKVVRAAKTLAWVAPLTLLIWIYAEREQVAKETVSDVAIVLSSDSPERVVSIVGTVDNRISIDVSGPRAGVDRVRQQLNGEMGRGGLVLPVMTQAMTPGALSQLQVSDRISQLPLFQYNGVTVVRCTPAYLPVQAEVLQKLELPVVASPRDMEKFGKIGVTARPVWVSAPASVFDRARALPELGGKLAVYTNLSSVWEGPRPDTYEGEIPLVFPAPSPLVEMPKAVMGVVKPSGVETLMRDNLPVFVVQSLEVERTVNLSWDPAVLQRVKFVGPPDQIALLAGSPVGPDNKPLYYAQILVSAITADQRLTFTRPSIEFHIPKDVTVEGDFTVTVTATQK